MAVGTIANISISAYPTYINVSFAKPANTTKFLVVLVDPNTGYTFYSNYFSSSNATGNTVTCKVTGVIAGHSYIVYVTPYNGTTAGTQKQYLNSPLNLVKVPSSTTSSQAEHQVEQVLQQLQLLEMVQLIQLARLDQPPTVEVAELLLQHPLIHQYLTQDL